MLPTDLKNYRGEPDAFQILEEGQALVAFLVFIVLCFVLWPILK